MAAVLVSMLVVLGALLLARVPLLVLLLLRAVLLRNLENKQQSMEILMI